MLEFALNRLPADDSYQTGGLLLKIGPAQKVSLYVGEDEQYHGTPRYVAILEFLFFRGVAGATIVRGIAGFGAGHHLHTTRILRLTENLPIKIEFIESQAKVNELLPKLQELAGTGLIELYETTVVKPASTKSGAAFVHLPHRRMEGEAKLMRVYVRESERWHDKPLYHAIVESLRANDIAGVSVYCGIFGYGANARDHKQSKLGRSHDRPILLVVVDTEEKIRAFLRVLDDMILCGFVVLSDVHVIKYTHTGITTQEATEG